MAAVVGDAQQVPGHGAGHHQQPRAGNRARELHVRPENTWGLEREPDIPFMIVDIVTYLILLVPTLDR